MMLVQLVLSFFKDNDILITFLNYSASTLVPVYHYIQFICLRTPCGNSFKAGTSI